MKKLILFTLLSMPTILVAGPKEILKVKTSAICEMCKSKIEKNLALTKGVKSANLNLDDKVVTVEYNSEKTNALAIRKAIAEVGYDADDMPAEKAGYDKLSDCCKKK
ncbi:heavy-metal-associated domain-containing protein [Aquirufa sp. ROCK2-A2]